MTKTFEPESLDQDHGYTLEEICMRYHMESDFVVQCVDFGITVIQVSEESGTWLIPVAAVPRMEKAWRLHRDLGLDFTGLAIVLDLLDEIDQLKGNVERLSKRLGDWET